MCEESQLGQLPDNAGFEEGAGVWTPYATSYRALFEKAKASAGETVARSRGVGRGRYRGGSMGQERRAEGHRDGGFRRREAACIRTRRAICVVDHLLRIQDLRAWQSKISEFTGGKGVDVIIEMLANVNLLAGLRCLAMFGRIAVVGNRGTLDFNPRVGDDKGRDDLRLVAVQCTASAFAIRSTRRSARALATDI